MKRDITGISNLIFPSCIQAVLRILPRIRCGLAENNIAPVCFIYLTDLCCHLYPEAPEYPFLWLTDSRRTAPFGETLRIEIE